MKYTLLEMTQLILSSMDSDEVDSINDTTESLQVANVIRTAYFDMVTRSALPEDFSPFNLDASTSASPTKMSLPVNYANVDRILYNKETLTDTAQRWETVSYLSLPEFQRRMYALDETDTVHVGTYNLTVNGSTIPILYVKDEAPQFYTTFDDNTILFDSIDTAVETSLASIKSQGFGRRIKVFTMADSFTPELDDDQFPLLVNEAKSLAWAELKQTVHQKAEQSARRLKISQQKIKQAIKGCAAFDELPNFGRK